MFTGIYKITSPSGRIYIGQSKNIYKRWNSYYNLKDIDKQIKLHNSFKKYGVKNHKFEIICTCDFEHLNIKERYYQDFYDVIGPKGLNCLLTKTNEKPRVSSMETRQKISNSLRGRVVTEQMKEKLREKRKLYICTSETKEKLRISHLGYIMPEEQKRKISESNKNKVRSEESKLNISVKNKGKKRSEEQKQKLSFAKSKTVYQYSLTGEFIKEWKNTIMASKELKISRTSINYVCNNKKENFKGFVWSYIKY